MGNDNRQIKISDGPHPCGEENRYGVAWQGASIVAGTEDELEKIIEAYENKFWHRWIVGTLEDNKTPSAFLFKPKDCRCEWYEPYDLDRRKPLMFDDPAEGIRLLGNNITDTKSLQVYLKAVEEYYPKFMTLGGVSNRNNSLWSTYIAMDDQKNIKYLNIGHDGTAKWEDIDPETAQKRLKAAYFERIIGEWGIDKIGAQPSLFDAVEADQKINEKPLIPPSIYHAGGGELEPLNFELVGVLNIEKLISDGRADEIYTFYQHGHPNGKLSKYKPGMVKQISDDNGGKIAIFLATVDQNPESARKLFSSEDVITYKNQFPLEFKEEWYNKTFSFVEQCYKTATASLKDAVETVQKMNSSNSQNPKV